MKRRCSEENRKEEMGTWPVDSQQQSAGCSELGGAELKRITNSCRMESEGGELHGEQWRYHVCSGIQSGRPADVHLIWF